MHFKFIDEAKTLPLSWTRSGQTLRSAHKDSKGVVHVLRHRIPQKMKTDSCFYKKRSKCSPFLNKKTVLKSNRHPSSNKFSRNDLMDKLSLVTRFQLMKRYKNRQIILNKVLTPSRYDIEYY